MDSDSLNSEDIQQSETDAQAQPELASIIAEEVGTQLGSILPEALRMLLPEILEGLQAQQRSGLSDTSHSQEVGTPLRLPLSAEVIDSAKSILRPLESQVKLVRQAAKKANKKGFDRVTFHPEPGSKSKFLHQVVVNLISWKTQVCEKRYVSEDDVGPLFAAIAAIETTWRSEINIAFTSSLPGSNEKASRTEALRALERSGGDPFKAQAKLVEAQDRKAATTANRQSAAAMAAFQRMLAKDSSDESSRGVGRGRGYRGGRGRGDGAAPADQ